MDVLLLIKQKEDSMKTQEEISALIKSAVKALNSAAEKINEVANIIKDFGEGIVLSIEADTGQMDDNTSTKLYIKSKLFPGFTESQSNTIDEAISFWNQIILKGSDHGLTIDFFSSKIDGKSGTYGMAIPTLIDTKTGLPTMGIVVMDKDDLERLEKEGTLPDVIKHEIGHVLGFGTVWKEKGLLMYEDTDSPLFMGKTAIQKHKGMPIPVENMGSEGTRNAHWKETVFKDELMTGFIEKGDNPISKMTIASLADLGYEVSYKILVED